eukprot:398139-Pleurochrysis_carterae.AAC.2
MMLAHRTTATNANRQSTAGALTLTRKRSASHTINRYMAIASTTLRNGRCTANVSTAAHACHTRNCWSHS